MTSSRDVPAWPANPNLLLIGARAPVPGTCKTRLGASIAVLEGRHIGWGASGHHLGTVMPGFGLPVGDLIERVGLEDPVFERRFEVYGTDQVWCRTVLTIVQDIPEQLLISQISFRRAAYDFEIRHWA